MKDSVLNRHFLFGALLAAIFVSIFTSRIVVPLVYYPFYVLLLIGLFSGSVRYLHSSHVGLLVTILVIFLAHLLNLRDYSSNFIYTALWVANVLISVFVYNLRNTEAIERSLFNFGIFLISSFVLLRVVGLHPSNFYGSIGVNINLVVFFVTFSVYYLFKERSDGPIKHFRYPLALSSLLTGSRMHALMYLSFLALRYRPVLYLGSILLFAIAWFFLPSLSIVLDLFDYLSTGQFNFSNDFDDTRRIYLAIAAVESIKTTFPMGSGFGLENYLQFAGIGIQDAYAGSVRLSMSHNFYLSYLALSGIFFFPLLYFLVRPAFNSESSYKYLYIIFLVGIAFNEYVTSPIFWVVHGLMLRRDRKTSLMMERTISTDARYSL